LPQNTFHRLSRLQPLEEQCSPDLLGLSGRKTDGRMERAWQSEEGGREGRRRNREGRGRVERRIKLYTFWEGYTLPPPPLQELLVVSMPPLLAVCDCSVPACRSEMVRVGSNASADEIRRDPVRRRVGLVVSVQVHRKRRSSRSCTVLLGHLDQRHGAENNTSSQCYLPSRQRKRVQRTDEQNNVAIILTETRKMENTQIKVKYKTQKREICSARHRK